MKETLLNIYRLIAKEILTSSSLTIYLYCKLNEGKPVSVNSIHKATHLSAAIIRHHLLMMQQLDLLVWTAAAGKRSFVKCKPFTDDDYERVVIDLPNLSTLASYRDNKINKYNPKTFIVEKSYKEEGYTGEVLKYLSAQAGAFRMTPAYRAKLIALGKRLDLKAYSTWFIKHKLGKTVRVFGMGIFLYQGIIDEFMVANKLKQKHDAYKHVSSRKAIFESGAEKLEQEIANAI